ncbi:aryl-alcohol dehydrogenase-like predicted oxidoreductase [Pacificibacter maritimus]|uniref:Aryl-alcohol dehydrogenase-like predicted oxidoreductase n=2 Tax=Pacificibacter maritimus TaxID=762213 RepID=A0A3N4UA05_9RHOB|nr:aryl-alcohol dehydrogenase-like predicted oxidoreductase [Pacificibacter maritimus]
MVGAIGFGAMSFAGFFGPADDETSLKTLAAAEAAGIDFWDTANIYGMGRSESVIGRYFKEIGTSRPITLATKVGIVPGPPRTINNEAGYIRRELEASLTRLNRDHVELYYIHRREQDRPIEDVAETMGKLIEEGLIGGWGLSEVAPTTIKRAHAVTPLRAVQSEYSLWSREPELGVIQTCATLGIAFVPFSPLARGMITANDLTPNTFEPHDFRRVNPRFVEPNFSTNLSHVHALRDFAQGKGITVTALALAWSMKANDTVIPIPGTRTAEHMQDWLAAASLDLSANDLMLIEQIMPVGWAHGARYADTQVVGVERYC